MERIEFISRNPSDTIAIGAHIGARRGATFSCSTGSSALERPSSLKDSPRGSGVSDWEYVLSPSFTLIGLYEGGSSCATRTCTGLKADAVEGRLEDCLDSGVVAVEWAERVPLWRKGSGSRCTSLGKRKGTS